MAAIQSLSKAQARKLALHSQQLPPPAAKGTALAASLAAIEQLSYVQIDTISVIERAHHHTLWNRNPRYQSDHLNKLLQQKSIFEYWSHAAAYLPMRDFRYSLHRKQSFSNGLLKHWYSPNKAMMRKVLERIRTEGPLMSKDFEYTGRKMREWQSKPAKQALEYLFMQGDLMAPYRHNFHKVYDLTERVLPSDLDTRVPSDEEYARFLIQRFLQANGLALTTEFAYLLKNIKPVLTQILNQMVSDQELTQVRVAGLDYVLNEKAFSLLNKPLARRNLLILSPFDNLLIQRKRIANLFDFNYQIECYLPAVKRQYGYFSLPILWQGNLLARLDCKVERKTQVLHLLQLSFEPEVKDTAEFIEALCSALPRFMDFNGAQTLCCDQLPVDLQALMKQYA